jgi:putative membrane protein (TIGR04086 family)
MEKRKGSSMTVAKGVLITLVLYLAFQLLLAFLTVRAVLPEKYVFEMQAVICALSVFCGSLFTIRRTALGTLSASLLVAGCFILLLILVGLLAYDHISWSGRGGCLLLSAAIGGILSGLFGTKAGRRKRKKRVRKA